MAAALPFATRAADVTLPFANGGRQMATVPQKRPLILLTSRPPQLETPFAVFNEGVITPNDAFFVRYHLANIPLSIDPDQFRLTVKGQVENSLELGLGDLRTKFEAVETVAVNQCSGNSRGFFEPRVGGGQWANGAMGNARWKGVRLKDVLEKAGVKAGAVQVTFDGLDGPVVPQTPDYVKALEIGHALDGEVLLAYEMNGTDLPMLNGFPLRLVVPGYFATYWVKHLHEITVVSEPFTGFWMASAYRVADTPGHVVTPGTTPKVTLPIGRNPVRSFITSVADGGTLPLDKTTLLRGIAFDGGSGIREVLVSDDHGQNWHASTLGEDLGRYSFREWTFPYRPAKAGPLELCCRAVNRLGESQAFEPRWNPGGYERNVIETVKASAA
jgi:DMSO/TMAO reductase YedYZ molybdopterin-dependent catalytic subunit